MKQPNNPPPTDFDEFVDLITRFSYTDFIDLQEERAPTQVLDRLMEFISLYERRHNTRRRLGALAACAWHGATRGDALCMWCQYYAAHTDSRIKQLGEDTRVGMPQG